MGVNGGHKRVASCLKRYMREAGPEASMPSFRALSRQCRVSPITVSEVVAQFSDKHWLVVEPRKGVFTSADLPDEILSPVKLERVDVVLIETPRMLQYPGGYHQEMVYELGQQPCKLDLDVRLHRVEPGAGEVQKLRRIAADSGCRGVLISRLSSLDQLDPFLEASIPYICVYPESHELPPDRSVLVDIEALVLLQVEHLMELGHRRIGYLHNVSPTVYHRSHLLRRETLFRLALDLGLQIDSSIIQYGGLDPAEQEVGVRAILAVEERPTAIICNDEHLSVVYRVAQEYGLQIGSDLSVVGTNDMPSARAVAPQATTVDVSRGRAVSMALGMLEEALQTVDGVVPNQTIDLHLVERQSTGPVGKG